MAWAITIMELPCVKWMNNQELEVLEKKFQEFHFGYSMNDTAITYSNGNLQRMLAI